jgi:hypothetical protein
MTPKIINIAEKADGSFLFTAEDLDQPGILYGYDNVRLVQKGGEIYIEHELVASVKKESEVSEEEINRNGQLLLNAIWESIHNE